MPFGSHLQSQRPPVGPHCPAELTNRRFVLPAGTLAGRSVQCRPRGPLWGCWLIGSLTCLPVPLSPCLRVRFTCHLPPVIGHSLACPFGTLAHTCTCVRCKCWLIGSLQFACLLLVSPYREKPSITDMLTSMVADFFRFCLPLSPKAQYY